MKRKKESTARFIRKIVDLGGARFAMFRKIL